MIKNTFINPRSPSFPAEGERISGKTRVLQVLCVHENPVFLDRVCRHLEQRGDISVDISVAEEDALHLMRYIRFDIIVTGYTPGLKEKNNFLKTVRDTGNPVPFIYIARTRNTEVEYEARRFGAVLFVYREEESLDRGFEDLYRTIKMAAERSRKDHGSIAERYVADGD